MKKFLKITLFVSILFLFVGTSVFAATETLYPSGAGAETHLTPSPSPNWDAVNEIPANDNDYVSTGSAGSYLRDLYDLPTSGIPAGSTINSVTIYWRAIYSHIQAATAKGRPSLRTNGTSVNGTEVWLEEDWVNYSQTWATNPVSTVAWTLDEINALEIGVSLYISQIANASSLCSQVYVVIDYTLAAPSWPHIPITAPANVTVNQEFSVSLTYTHDANEVGGIHLRWQDGDFDIPDPAGCTVYDSPAFAPGWEGIECYFVNDGTTTTVTLRALTTGAKTLYYRAWDETRDYDCGTYLDYNRDPSAGTDFTKGSCTPQCHPDEFPDRWEDCDTYSKDITVTAPLCTCNAWTNDACGAAGCGANQIHQTRTCNPPGCDTESQCVNDSCAPWVNDACGAAGCSLDKVHQTRTCTYHCLPESQCVVNPACAPPPKTCAKLGGTCCSGGQICTAGKIAGASDCLECCSNVANCKSGGGGGGGGFFKLTNPLACKTFPECIEKIISFIFWVAMAIVPIMIIIAGFLFLTSGGDPEKVRTAKNMILYACIGLAIILLAKGIISLIKTVIGG